METQRLKEFVLKASQSTYASADQSIKQVQPDKSTTIAFSDEDFEGLEYHDNYFGGEPYGGREVVFLEGKPVWMMVYYGWVIKNQNADNVYEVLMAALRRSTIDMPYRGPNLYEQDGWRYANEVQGTFENFHGHEKIFNRGELVYEARYMGGLVDQVV